MTRDREPNFESDASDAMLDELLSQARWPQPDGGAEARLRDDYVRASARRSLKRMPALVAIAAMVGLVVGIWWVASWQHAKPQIAIVPPVAPVAKPLVEHTEPPPLVRPLGPTERLALIEDKQQSIRKSRAAAQQPKSDPLASLRRLDNVSLTRLASQTHDATRRDNAIRLLLERNDLQSFLFFVLKSNTRDDALAVLHEMPDPPIQALLAELDHQQVDYRLAAAKALGGLCDHQIDTKLMTMVAQNDHRREAIAALLSCSDPHAKQLLSQAQAYASADEIRSVQHDLNQTF